MNKTLIEMVEEVILEDITSGVLNFGGQSSQFSSDSYATGDSRIPKVLGGITKRKFPETITKSKKKKKVKKKRTKS